MKSKWLLVLAAALVVACQKPAPKAAPAPGATSGGGTAMRTDGGTAPDSNSVSAVGESGNSVANVEGKSDKNPVEPAIGTAEQVAGLVSGFMTEFEAFNVKMQQASPADRRTLMSERPDASPVYEKIKTILASSNDPEARFEGLLFAAQFVKPAESGEAIEELVLNHSANEKVLPFLRTLNRSLPAKAKEIFEKLVEGDENTPAKGTAMLSLAEMIQEQDQARAEELLVNLTQNFADVSVGGSNLAELAGPILFGIQHLGIGKEAPEIEGADLDSVSFKLSDYRGKVVVIDFWGDW